jgi:Fe-S cluster biogenesis protein NfuA
MTSIPAAVDHAQLSSQLREPTLERKCELTMLEDVNRMLDASIRPKVQAHGGDIAVQSITSDGHVEIAFYAACTGCGMRQITLGAIREALRQVPGVSSVGCSVSVSRAAAERLNAFFGGSGYPSASARP